jgi:hypothetical protein
MRPPTTTMSGRSGGERMNMSYVHCEPTSGVLQ